MITRMILFCLLGGSGLWAAALSLGRLSLKAGESVEASLSFLAQGALVTAIQFDLDYDDAQLRITASAGPAAFRAEKDLAVNGKRYVIAGLNQNALSDGVLVVLRLSASGSVAGSYPLRLTRVVATDKDGRAVGVTASDGTVTVEAPVGAPQVNGNGVLHGGTFRSGLAASTWISIFGSNLAASTRAWSGRDFAGNKLPVELDGVRVRINGKPGYVSFISPSQVNVLAPDDDAEGPVSVQLVNAQGGSNTVTVTKKRTAPGFFLLDPEGRKYLAAVHADGTLAGRAGLIPGVTTRPARPGDVILLYGTGFGLTNPRAPAGEVFSQALPLAEPVTVRFGDAAVVPLWAGLISPGLYQFNIRVPELPDGDVAVTAEAGGEPTPAGCFVTVSR